MIGNKKISWLGTAVVVVVFAATGYYFLDTLWRSWDQVRRYDYVPSWQIVPALLLFVGAVLLTGLTCRLVLRRLSGGKPISPAYAIKTHNTAWLLKYLPGQGGLVLGKLSMLAGIGFTKKEILVSVVYENVYLVAASFALSVPVILLSGIRGESDTVLWLLGSFTAGLIVLASPPVFYRLLNRALRLMRRAPLEREFFLNFGELSRFFILFLLPRLANGAAFVLLLAAFVPVAPAHYLPLGASYILASVVGMLAILVPGGIGVREGVLTLFLSQYYAPELAVMLSLITRLVVTVGDGLLFLINLFIAKE
jgi:uncharacterized membrane protein YbhN (UPF0104 family)